MEHKLTPYFSLFFFQIKRGGFFAAPSNDRVAESEQATNGKRERTA
jgi:hypothetical protein